MNKQTHQIFKRKRGFSLVELMTVVVIIMILAISVGPLFRNWIEDMQTRNQTSQVDMLIRRTMAESIRTGYPAQIVIAGSSITGQLATNTDGDVFEPVKNGTVALEGDRTFSRTSSSETPWLKSSAMDSLSEGDTPNVLEFSRIGVPENGAAIFIEHKKKVTAIEILPTGSVVVSHWENEIWSR